MVKSTITGTRLAAAPAERITFSIRSAVNSSAGISVMVALSRAVSKFKSASPMAMGSLISLFTTWSWVRVSTRMKPPVPDCSRLYFSTVALPCRAAALMAGRLVAWETSLATRSTSLSTWLIFSSMAVLMDLVSSTLRR